MSHAHAFQIAAGKSVSITQAQQLVDKWLSNHQEVLDAQRSDLSVANTALDGSGTEYFRGMYRFHSNEDKQTILDEIETDLSGAVNWYRIEYHECSHYGDGGGACPDWSVERSGGSIPSDV